MGVLAGPPVIAAVLPGSAEGREVLRAYFCEIVGRLYGRAASTAEVDAAMAGDPSDALVPPTGLLLVARRARTTVGCAGLLLLPGRMGEVKRVFVDPAARGGGVGTLLMRAIEDAARSCQLSRLRLDTRSNLTEARRLYEREGSKEVAPFTDDPLADHWYEKILE
jgi:GNAT superfamily N-acetyltransferase